MFALIPLIASTILLRELMFVYPEAPVSIELIAVTIWSASVIVLLRKVALKITDLIRDL